MSDDNVRPTFPVPHQIGADLSALSIKELEERVDLLREEIVRLEAELESKGASWSAAENLFTR